MPVPSLLSRASIAAFLVTTLIFILYPRSSGLPPSGLGAFSGSKSHAAHNGPSIFNDINNATLGFQKIFAINMPARTDHRDAISLAAHFTDIKVEFISGIAHVDDKALPPALPETNLKPGEIGSWRAHMNAIRTMVEQNISSALIMEDDVDWDLRIKPQLQEFAKVSRYLLQPIPGTNNEYYDTTNPRRSSDEQGRDLTMEGAVTVPTTSPYGDLDRWDVLWLGHCGVRFAEPSDEGVPLGRVPMYDDETVPERQHLKEEWGSAAAYDQYPQHTRVVHTPVRAACTLAYALSLPAARRLLYEFGIKTLDHSFDMLLRHACQGTHGRKLRTCLTVQPQLFQHHRAAGASSKNSDINQSGGDDDKAENPNAYTPNIRMSTRVNFPKLIEGETDYIDQLKDGEDPPYWFSW